MNRIFSHITRLFVTLFLFLVISPTYSQRAQLFTTDSELPSSLIFDLHQDNKGQIWMATEDGLCRYDGAKITTYKTNNSNILNNYSKFIFEDSKGHLFFGFFNGLQVYDHNTDRFTTIPLLLENGTPFYAHTMTILERKNGDILIGSSGLGIFKLNEDSTQLVGKQMPNLISGNLIRYLFEDQNQNLWIATNDEGLYKVTMDGRSFNYFASDSRDFKEVSAIVQNNKGQIFIGTTYNGFYEYLSQSDSFNHINSMPSNMPIVTLNIRKQDDKILIGTDGYGIKYFDPITRKISNLNFEISNLDLSKSKVHSILEDMSGNTWLGLFQKGVALIPSNENNFDYIGNQSIKSNLIGTKYIMSLWKDHAGDLWVGSDGDGVYKLSKDNNEQYTVSKTYDSSPSTVLSVFEDSNHNLWLGSYGEGLYLYNRKSKVFEKFKLLLDHLSKPIENVTFITEDNHGKLWLGTLGGGIFSIQLNSMKVTQLSSFTPNPTNNDNSVLHNNWVSSLYTSRDDKLYIGTYDGVSCLDLNSGHFSLLNNIRDEFKGKIIYSLHEDSFGQMWFGTSQGLISFNPTTNKLVSYTIEDGLPSNVICGIRANGDKLWISTNYGISQFDTSTGIFFNYYYNDGLQGNEFAKSCSFKDKKGNIYYGGINGITIFKPNEIKTKVREPEINITALYLGNQPVNTNTKSGSYQVTQQSILETNHIDLSHDDNSFTIEFTAMEFSNPQRINYYYSMDNSKWIGLQPGTNTVTFSNLSPGSYQFRVRSKDYNTLSEPKTLSIQIHPAWYLSGWAKILYSITTALILWIIYFLLRQRLEIRKKMKAQQQDQKINQAKLEFFINISHEIRTPITLIINPLRKLIKQDTDEKRHRDYFIMQRSAERILKLVNQLLDIRKIDKGQLKMKFQETDIIQFLQETSLIFDEQIHGKDIKFSINASKNTLVYLDPNHFDKVIQNILSNAIKYTPHQGEIDIYVKQGTDETHNPSYISIEVYDTGSGINEEEIERIFDRFYQSSDDKSSNPEGTGIGLHLTRSIVELHHGTIRAGLNPSGQGTSFLIHLPLGRQHLNEEEITEPDSNKSNGNTPRYYIPIVPIVEQAKSKSKLNVLIVDDDDEIRNYLVSEFSEDYHTAASMNGEKAYAEILKKSPDLIISDVVMPKMDGVTLCKKIKHNVNVNHIPVILLTAKTTEEDKLRGLDTGADAYIAKPFNIDILKKTVANLIKNRQLLKNNYNGNQLQNDKIKKIEVQSTDDILMQKIMTVINENIANSELNVEMIASEIGFSRVHLHRKLKEITSQSARDLIKNTRLKQAGDLLNHKQISISEVAYATGFSSPAKFSTSFKEFYGIAPSRYVEQKQQDKKTRVQK
ncbi:hybrid sensor histidine kinase/response regulator [Reichenbachiella agariperforans]|uniref:hybrid sensor histidine kinase/response regulator n=1 Tax=Reichenbachiella agariperforans TaxID=156994 RepID=UPI001C083F00|nr:two-component regulator propeller domain-containing protein [Reichenbachiella agariperforans]MBU2914449.1 response regulator [Reichenbachiella agariperforans]